MSAITPEVLARVAKELYVVCIEPSPLLEGGWLITSVRGSAVEEWSSGDLLLAVLERAAAMGHAVGLTWDYSAAPHAWCCTIGQGADPYVDGVPSGRDEGPLVAALLAFSQLPQCQEGA